MGDSDEEYTDSDDNEATARLTWWFATLSIKVALMRGFVTLFLKVVLTEDLQLCSQKLH